jgi:hypothetical protein
MDDATAAEPQEDLTGIPECFVPVARKYGRDLFAFVYNVEMVKMALVQVSLQADKHASRSLAHVHRVVAQALGTVAGMTLADRGWTDEQLAEVNNAIEAAHVGEAKANLILLPGLGGMH